MGKKFSKKILTLISVLIITNIFSQTSKDGLWSLIPSKEIEGDKVRRSSFPSNYYLFNLDLNLLKSKLANAPVLGANTNQSALILDFPNSAGNFEKFVVYESSIMDPILEAKFPMIKTYAAQGIDDPTATMRFSVTQFGLHTMSLSGIKSTIFIDPYTTDLMTYIVYDRNTLGADPQPFECLTSENVTLPSLQKNTAGPLTVQNINDQKLRTFRLAQSCTGEYGAIFMGTGTVAQQKANVQAQMTITMNRVNSVYERDLAIHMNFIANNDLLIYMAAGSDPWSNEWNTKTAQTIDAAIGVANYDIGHNFNTTGGGNAGCLSCVCLSASQSGNHKGRGYTGRSNPTGDAFDIDYVAHEMGHQFGGYHVMNTCSRSGNGTTEVEPASGSSIMGYAGICPTNIQNNSHDDFNYVNIRDISANIKTGNSTCGAITTLTNTPPTANAGADYVIPKSTAYILEGTATDVNGMGSLTYNWSQNDPTQSPGSGAPQSTYSVGPLYRSIRPTISPNRYMPALTTVISNALSSTWEVTPSVTRTLNFSFIVRDNHVGGGQTASDLMKVTVNGTAGPFVLTSQGSATSWTAATTQTITWNVAGTSTGAVNTPSVNIFFSTDGGYNYPITLATNVLNNGSAIITVPSVTTTTGRVMVRGAGNIFYDINNANITVVAGAAASPVSNFSVASTNPCTSSSIQLNDQSLNAPTSWTWTATSSSGVTFSNANAQNPTVTFANAGTYTVSLIAKNASGNNTSNKVITVNATPTVSVNSATICSGNSTALTANGATTYNWSTSATTQSISVSPNTTTSYTVTGNSNGCTNSTIANVTVKTTPTVSVNSATICSGNSTALTANGATTYNWSTSATTQSISVSPNTTTSYTVTGNSNGCTNSTIANVTVKTTPTVSVNSATICSGNSTALTANGATTYNWSTSATTQSISVSPNTTTSYTVTGNSNGCTNSTIANVTVKTTPTVSVNSATICSGNSTALTANGATTYNWSTSATTQSISVSPNTTTSYTVTGSSNGCTNSTIANVTVKTTPTVSVNSATICSGNSTALTANGATTYNWSTSATTQSISVSPSTTTSYTVTGNSNGCTNSSIANVTVKTTPTVSVNSATICSGNSTALTANGATTYNWSTSATTQSISVSPSTTTSYTVTGSSNGCTNSTVANVTVNSLPNVTLGSVSGPLCVNSPSVGLSGTPSGGVYSGPGVNGSAFNPATSGVGTFTLNYNYTDANTCSASASQIVIVNTCTGISELSDNLFVVFPNPTTGNFTIDFKSNSIENASVELFDAIGKLVLTEVITENTTTLSFDQFAKGIYLVKIKNNNNYFVTRIIKQ